MVSFRSARKLSSYLVRAKLYPLKRKVGSFECKGKRCQTCLNVNETDSFASSVTKEEYKINHCFDCSKKMLDLPSYLQSLVKTVRRTNS